MQARHAVNGIKLCHDQLEFRSIQVQLAVRQRLWHAPVLTLNPVGISDSDGTQCHSLNILPTERISKIEVTSAQEGALTSVHVFLDSGKSLRVGHRSEVTKEWSFDSEASEGLLGF